MRHDNNGASNLVTGLALGALLGGTTALLLAPQSGKKSLRSLKTGMGTVKSKLGVLARRRREDFRQDPADSGKEDYFF